MHHLFGDRGGGAAHTEQASRAEHGLASTTGGERERKRGTRERATPNKRATVTEDGERESLWTRGQRVDGEEGPGVQPLWLA